ncbi:methyl-accepting chemotaxis protein [Vibrio mangrovi]|uniref:Methyl-accepting chemotaxis protein n=1 Tax=Vibrio mangrovi TaxID=474394 RepID=A0A1Y6IU16_9VIBR|nr:methyl-accepting chemotaxis protein [Vibrio mangrovi]MDW6001467.1 methyl-accepting chemotaxis protein [Vibrio mangrovi]SMS00511.1 Methyl-accepting chemotaxis protein CtpH [Vibrio mangrovi]
MLSQLTTSARLWLFAILSILGIALIGLSGTLSLHKMGSDTYKSIYTIESESNGLMAVEQAKISLLLQVKAFKDALIRGNTKETLATYSGEFRQHRQEVVQFLDKTRQQMQKKQLSTQQIQTLIQRHRTLSDQYMQALDKYQIDDPNAGKKIDAMVKGIDRPALTAMNELVHELETHFSHHIEQQLANMDTNTQQATFYSLLISCSGVLIIIALSVWINRNIMRQLGGDPAYATKIAKTIAAGNLTTKIQLRSGDNDSLLAQMYDMQSSLSKIITQIHQAGDMLASESQQLAAASHQAAISMNQQNDASATIASAIEELTYGINQVTENATQAMGLSDEARTSAVHGAGSMKETIRDIDIIAGSLQSTTQSIQRLGEQSNQIHHVIAVIREIADQTNLLALNAAIEAARAGESGRGFAVVADEVRTLAEKTGSSTVEIAETITSIQKDTHQVINEMEGCMSQMQPVINAVDSTDQMMKDIESGTQRVLNALDEITQILNEQTKSSDEVSQSVEETVQINRANSQAITEVSDAAHSLRDIAQNLLGSVQRFSV